MVGDPKQAIYRFRGADIDVYKDVEKLFRGNNIGEVVRLSFNYRSAQEICDLTAQVFKPDGTSPVPGEADRVSQTLDGGYYQASYTDMTAWNGNCTRARTLYYEPLKGDDCKSSKKKYTDASRVAAFIKSMYTDHVSISCVDKKSGGFISRPVRYSDFLILPPFKDDVVRYASALIDAGIPVNVTGKQVFKEIDPIRRLLIHLNSLSSPGNDLALGKVLVFCYEIKLPTIRRFMQQAKIRNISSALYKEKIEALGDAFSSANNIDREILSLCAVLKELSELREMVRTKPAMSVIETLLDGGYSIWSDCDSIDRRKREYAYVQQFLQLLRRSPEHEFSALAAFAAECSNRSIEHELTLEHNRDAVCVMNVHKSKGLEGEIVILPYATNPKNSPTILHHARRTDTERQHECCLYTPNGLYHKTICATPPNWNTESNGSSSSVDREDKYLLAEKVRLLYVAATRAATMLLVCDDANEVDGYWKAIALGCKPLTSTDPEYGAQFSYLIQQTNSTPKTNSVSTPVDTYTIENNLEKLAQNHLKFNQYPITPSKLDSASRSAITRKDREENDTLSPDALAAPADTAKDAVPANDSFMPHGPDWGTIIHRIMELSVRHKSFDADSISSFASQAVVETLSDGLLSKGQKKMLFGSVEQFPENWLDELSHVATQAAAFLGNTGSSLRQLLNDSKCFPELPFILRETDRGSPLYHHLSNHIKDPNAKNKDLDVQGVIDLAIWKNGEWTVVDYKTDRIKKGESREEYIGRLREEYTAQIASYAQVLERLGKGKTTHAYLCSIPLGGELVELDLGNGTDCGQKAVTTQASPAAQTTATTPAADPRTAYAANKLFANNYFHRALSDASGTFDFTLVMNNTPVKLVDKNGNCVTNFYQCRQFVAAVENWLQEQYPNENCSINLTNAGNQALLRRMLRVMCQVMPPKDWNAVELKWNIPND